MREAASRGFFLGSKAPFGYTRVKVNDGVKERPTLEVDPATAPVVREIFESSLRGNGLKEICRELNDRGVTNRGKRWYKGGLHYLLTNEPYTGAAVWGRTSKGEKATDPVRVEGAWEALVPRELFDAVQQAMRDRAPAKRKPGRVGSKFLLSGLLRCGVYGRPYTGQGARSGQFAYYIGGTLYREGAGTYEARYLNAPRVEDFVVEKIRERILTEETIVGTFPERKVLIRNFVKGIEVTLTNTIPMPSDGVTTESASVLDFVQSGPSAWRPKAGRDYGCKSIPRKPCCYTQYRKRRVAAEHRLARLVQLGIRQAHYLGGPRRNSNCIWPPRWPISPWWRANWA